MNVNRRSWSFLDTSIEESFFWSLALSLLPVVSAFAISWFIARWAGPAVWGTVAWTMAFATALLIVGKFGLELGASRLASEYGVNRPGTLRSLFRVGFGLRIVFTLPVAAFALVFARQIAGWFNDPSLSGPVRVAAGIIVCASVYEFFEHFIIGLNRHAVVSKVRSLMLILRVVLSVAIVLAGLGAVAVRVLGGYCVAWAVAIAVFAAMLLGRLPARDRSDPGERALIVRRLLALSIPLAVSSASVTVYSQIDKLMLGYFNGVEEVGQYAVARAVTEVSLFPAFAFVMTLRPALASRYASGALDECAELIRKSLRASLAFGVLFAAVYVVLAPPLLEWVYSTEFRYAGTLMTAFVWVLVMRSLGAMVLPALVAAERTRLYAYLTVFSAVINFGLNLVLIPRYQATGAIVATIVSYGFLLVVGLGQTFRIFGVKIRLDAVGGAFRTVLAGVATSILVWLLLGQVYVDGKAQPDARVILWVFLLVGVYAALLWMLKVFRTDDVRTVFSTLRNRRRNLK